MASVRLSDSALQDIERIDPVIAERIIAKLMWFEKNFVDVMPGHLHHGLHGLYKLRIGDYRAVYSVRNDIIVIEEVGHRRDIYR